ncbi:MAG: hypothetical protein AVDCRST_MAG10-3215, partial [uncultured Acidimicrobiales bacterium]
EANRASREGRLRRGRARHGAGRVGPPGRRGLPRRRADGPGGRRRLPVVCV